MAFEEFKNKGFGRGLHNGVIVYATGGLGLASSVARKYFEDVSRVTLHYDAATRQIGIKPSDRQVFHSLSITRCTKKAPPTQVSGRAFTSHYNLRGEQNIACSAEWSNEHGMLIVQLPMEES